MKTSTSNQKHIYDHRLREFVRQTGDISSALSLGVPRSTASGWRTSSPRAVVSHELFDLSDIQIRARILNLEKQVRVLTSIMPLLLTLVRLSRHKLKWERLPEGDTKRKLLRAIERARRSLPLRAALKIVGLSPARYHAWRRSEADDCPLDDVPSCPKTHPTQLLPENLDTMREMATSSDYRHVPTSTLAILAQRVGKVFAAPSTWSRYVRQRGWRRPRKRIHPAKPTEGLRADKPDGMWHIDTSVIRLLDGTKAYVQAIIDNCSRRILAWRVDARLEPGGTAALLLKAFRGKDQTQADGDAQSLMVDGGVENMNRAVNELCDQGLLKLILAQTDLHFSNSMIEAFWLYLNNLDSITALRRLVRFYIDEHNRTLPHSALNGLTPDEKYFGTGEHVLAELELGKKNAREARLEANRALACETCRETWGELSTVN